MGEMQTIPATARTANGTGAARSVRREGKVPGIVYGGGAEPMAITVDSKALESARRQRGFFAQLYRLEIDGQAIRVLPRDVQLHPVTDRPLHVDFQRVAEGEMVRVWVPVRFLNSEQSPGLKRGGTLNVVRHELELVGQPERIPTTIEIDLTGLNINTSIHISHVTLPEGVRPAIRDRDFTVATIVGSAGAGEAPGGEAEKK